MTAFIFGQVIFFFGRHYGTTEKTMHCSYFIFPQVCDVTLIADTALPTSQLGEPTYINSDVETPDHEQHAKEITVAAAAIGMCHRSMIHVCTS